MKTWLKKAYQRYIIEALSAMGLGLFSSLIIGLILSQLSQISFLGFLAPYGAVVSASSPVVGAAIGVAIGYGLRVKPLAVFSCAAAGACLPCHINHIITVSAGNRDPYHRIL